MKKEEFNRLVVTLYHLVVSADHSKQIDQFKDFKEAQKLIVQNIIKIESIISSQKLTSKNKKIGKSDRFERQITILKEFGNAMAWKLTGENETDLRAYFGAGFDSGHLKDKNIDTSLRSIEYVSDIKDGFILLTDITTVINTGDLLIVKSDNMPRVIEMKEGKVNGDLIAIFDNLIAQAEYIKQMPENKRKVTERQIKRLNKQHQRLVRLNEYMIDGTKRFDEVLDTHVQIFSPDKPLRREYYNKQLQSAYDNLPTGDIKTVNVTGGISVLVTKKPYDKDDIAYFQHTMYHKINHLSKQQCMINDSSFTQEQINAEIKGMQEMEIFVGIQGIATGGYKPSLIALNMFSDEMALDLLLGKSMFYFYVDKEEFLNKMREHGLPWSLKKRSSNDPRSKGLLVYKNKNILIDGTATLTTNFLHRMVRSYTKPIYEFNILKLGVKEAKRQIDILLKTE